MRYMTPLVSRKFYEKILAITLAGDETRDRL